MNVRLLQGAVGQNFTFMPRQIIECPDEDGQRLIRDRIAVKAKDDAEIDGEWPTTTPEEQAKANAAARAKYKKMGLDPDKVLAKRAKARGIERAIKSPVSTPESGKGEGSGAGAGTCTGTTSAGNPCKKAPVAGTDRCANHTEG